jgi:hypothetical protein
MLKFVDDGWMKVPSQMTTAALLLAIVLGSLSLSGCEDPTIWSSETRSPDGKWLARAHTVQHTGPGADGVETIVEIKRDSGLHRSFEVLGFSDDESSLHLAMKWKDSSNLDVTYQHDPSVLYFQVLKISGVNVAVQNTQGQP